MQHIKMASADATGQSQHRQGFMRNAPTGAPLGRKCAKDQLARMIAVQSATIQRVGGEGYHAASATLCDAEELQHLLCDGSTYQPPAPTCGHAASRRLPTRQKSAAQIRF